MLQSIVVVGSQWGDEGKGKITNYLSERADVVVRYQGGNNAGHSVVFEGHEFHLQTIPSGIFNPNTINILGNGMVINPIALYEEILKLQAAGFDCKNLIISNRAHLDLNYHLVIDGLNETNAEKVKIGTTKKGIGPCYTDKAARNGLRFVDLLRDDFDIIYKRKVEENNEAIVAMGGEPIEYNESLKTYLNIAKFLKPMIKDTVTILANFRKLNKKILFEGAQGTMLDIDFGTYPFVTSSNTIAGGAIPGSGIGLGFIDGAVAIVKAYTTRVGEGPFVTEQNNELGDIIREKAHEYGVVTHRPRRVGWLDLVQLRYSKNVNGFSYVSLMLLDILSNLKEIKVCVGYKLNGKEIDYYPANLDELGEVQPIYKTFSSWNEDITGCRTFSELPENAKNYVKFIEDFLDVKACLISVGPSKEQTIITEEIF